MTDIWFISDHHLQHANILKFTSKKDGTLLRPEFDNVDQMDEYILEQHNQSIKDEDIVYFLGDVVWKNSAKAYNTLKKFKGHKRLTIGNHDNGKELAPYFERVYLWRKFEEVNGVSFIASHCPLNEWDMVRTQYSVHGHLHEKNMLDHNGHEDMRFFNVSCEQLGYEPIHIDDLTMLLKDN